MVQTKLFLLAIIFIFVLNGAAIDGKVTLPAAVEITIDKHSTPGKPIKIKILAISKIPFKDGSVELLIPGFGSHRPKQIKLWSGHADSPIKKHLNHSLLLPFPGKYKIKAYFRFTSLREGASQITAAKSLYLDINSETVSSTNISFKSTKQTQLNLEGTKGAAFVARPAGKESVKKTSQKKSTILIKKAPLQGYKEVARKTTGEINREKLDGATQQSKYKNSEQAKAKRKAKEKKDK
jgi:hypothetical protein